MKTVARFSRMFGFLLIISFNIFSTSSAGLCQEERENYFRFIEQHPNVSDSPQGFVPDCNENGEFMAMQRNENYFFCVATNSGNIIPNSEVTPGTTQIINENLCQQYSNLWSQFLEWYEENNTAESTEIENENVTEESCKSGFEYRSCGCPHACIAGRNMSEVEVICSVCKPICTCPVGSYQYDGECISNQQCMDKEPELTDANMKNFMWVAYFSAHGSEVLKHSQIPPEEESSEGFFEPENNDGNWIESETTSQEEEEEREIEIEPEIKESLEASYHYFFNNLVTLSQTENENEETTYFLAGPEQVFVDDNSQDDQLSARKRGRLNKERHSKQRQSLSRDNDDETNVKTTNNEQSHTADVVDPTPNTDKNAEKPKKLPFLLDSIKRNSKTKKNIS